ncbi:MAG: FecR family protein [Tannerellaceae bacterium]|nr:FecR family protein [Tannerellaceae bacterium]
MAILLGINSWKVAKQPIPEPQIEIVKECHLITAAGSKGRFVLPDSTVVWLNGGSRLVYPEKFSELNRLVSIEGCGYFDVIPDEERPFIV